MLAILIFKLALNTIKYAHPIFHNSFQNFLILGGIFIMRGKFLFTLLFLLALPFTAYAMTAPTDIDNYTEALTIDYTQAAQLPLTGYFERKSDDRTMKIYIAPEASIRSYFTVVAVPDGVDTTTFLEQQGWFDLMDEKGEGLFVLEPGANGWGTAQEEAEYINTLFVPTARGGVNSKGIPVLSTFGEFYFVGYGAGAAPLELYAAQNPILVISQVYIGGDSTLSDLNTAGATLYDGTNTSGYDPGLTDETEFKETLELTGLSQIAKKDVPIPSWFINYADDADSLTYWRNANDCVATATDGVYWQNLSSTRPQTLYSNSQLSSHGISQVRVSSAETYPTASSIYEWLSVYTRYDVTFAYSNAIAYRLDYTSARVAAQQQAKNNTVLNTYNTTDWKGNAQTVNVIGRSNATISGHGTVQVGVFTFSDNDGDGVNDPREYIIYVPSGFSGKSLPVLFVYPGNTQTDSIFFDSTLWYQVADKEGIVLVFVCETYSSAVAVTHKDSYLYQTAMMSVLENSINGNLATLDFTRVYATGQSMGSMTTQDMARVNPGFFAAVASTSGVTFAVNDLDFGTDASSDKAIPNMLLIGQSDLPGLMPDLTSDALTIWGNYFMKVNGLNKTVGTEANNYGSDSNEFLTKRHYVYTWNDTNSIAVFKWGLTLLRPHNCYPSEMPILWDFLKHFSLSSDGTRAYSASAFTEDDSVTLFEDNPSDEDDAKKVDENLKSITVNSSDADFIKYSIGSDGTINVTVSSKSSVSSFDFTVDTESDFYKNLASNITWTLVNTGENDFSSWIYFNDTGTQTTTLAKDVNPVIVIDGAKRTQSETSIAASTSYSFTLQGEGTNGSGNALTPIEAKFKVTSETADNPPEYDTPAVLNGSPSGGCNTSNASFLTAAFLIPVALVILF